MYSAHESEQVSVPILVEAFIAGKEVHVGICSSTTTMKTSHCAEHAGSCSALMGKQAMNKYVLHAVICIQERVMCMLEFVVPQLVGHWTVSRDTWWGSSG